MFTTSVTPDFRRIVAAAKNQKAEILPLYEHNVCGEVISELSGVDMMAPYQAGNYDEAFKIYNGFFRQVGYDVVTFEQCITSAFPTPGALLGGIGPIQSRQDILNFPWNKVPDLWYDMAAARFEAMGKLMPTGMKAIGGVGNGVFEISEDLVGLEFLPFLQADDEDAYGDLYKRIGDLMATIWERFLNEFGEIYCVCRFGDDLGFRTSLLTMPGTVRDHIIPQYKRIIDLVHSHSKPFLLHSCGCIFEVMDDLLACKIDAKHSNEDAIAPFDRWIELYGDKIGLFGGIDMDFIVSKTPEMISTAVTEKAEKYYRTAKGFAIGTGNSIPDYVPAKNYLAMLEAVNEIREKQAKEVKK